MRNGKGRKEYKPWKRVSYTWGRRVDVALQSARPACGVDTAYIRFYPIIRTLTAKRNEMTIIPSAGWVGGHRSSCGQFVISRVRAGYREARKGGRQKKIKKRKEKMTWHVAINYQNAHLASSLACPKCARNHKCQFDDHCCEEIFLCLIIWFAVFDFYLFIIIIF